MIHDRYFQTSTLSTSIRDNGELHDLDEIISELEKLNSDSSTNAMSDHSLFLNGKKEMLTGIIAWLKEIAI